MKNKWIWACIVALGALMWLVVSMQGASMRSLCTLDVASELQSAPARGEKNILWWTIDENGQLFEQHAQSPIWSDQLVQALADEKATHKHFRIALSIHPRCPIKPLLAFMKACADQKVSLSLYLMSQEKPHGSHT